MFGEGVWLLDGGDHVSYGVYYHYGGPVMEAGLTGFEEG